MYKATIIYTINNKTQYSYMIANRFEYSSTHLYVFHNEDLVGIFKIENVIGTHFSEVKQ